MLMGIQARVTLRISPCVPLAALNLCASPASASSRQGSIARVHRLGEAVPLNRG